MDSDEVRESGILGRSAAYPVRLRSSVICTIQVFRSSCLGEEIDVALFFLACSGASRYIPFMGRLPRAIDDGLIDHALNRGNNRADVFIDDEDREAFLAALALTTAKYPFQASRLLSHDKSFSSASVARNRPVDQPHPPVAHRGSHLALSQAPSLLGPRLAVPVQESGDSE